MVGLVVQEDENVVKVDDTDNVEEIMEDVLDEGLKGSGCISESEWHDCVFEKSEVRSVHRLPFINILDLDEIESIFKVNHQEDLATFDTIKQVVNEG